MHCRGTTWWGSTAACYAPKNSALKAALNTISSRPTRRYESYPLGVGGREWVAQMVCAEKLGGFSLKWDLAFQEDPGDWGVPTCHPEQGPF